MKKLYSLLIALPFAVLLASCEKDNGIAPAEEDKPKFPTEQDYNAFLTKTTPSFMGNINGSAFSWNHSPGQFQLNIGKCDYPDSLRELKFSLVAEGSNKNYFTLYFPYYNFKSEDDLNRIFGLGKKKTGDLVTDFHLIIEKENTTYQTVSSLTTNEIEILKKEEYVLEGLQWEDGVSKPYLDKRLRIWFKINAQLSSCSSCPNSDFPLVTGLMIAEVDGYEGDL